MNKHIRKMQYISNFQADSWGNGIVGSFIAQNPIILDRITNAEALEMKEEPIRMPMKILCNRRNF